MNWTLLFGLLFLLTLSYLIFFLNDLCFVIKQLGYITDHETNAELTSTSKNKLLRNLLDKNNLLIKKNKAFYQKKQKKEQQVKKILTNLTHDLKTPLTVSTGYVQLLSRETTQEGHKEIIKKIDRSLADISQYLNYLMEYNLIQEKEITLSFEVLNISKILQENLFNYYQEFENQNIHLELDIQEQQILLLDEAILQRIFQNVLGNILKHGHHYAHIILKENGDSIKITFSNGLLEPVEDVQVFFDRFFTEDSSRSNKSTGLGLGIIKELAELIHCEVILRTEQNEFCLTLILKNSLG
ncbi:sensor histidine kinase [Enterococcus sp. DIV0187]|uniref:sensor histidine kinase n=1 Tax=Enterococcus sp. DIV0187 TaxID=2774644 RepID=UPI003F225DA1